MGGVRPCITNTATVITRIRKAAWPVLVLVAACHPSFGGPSATSLDEFAAQIERFRSDAHIPAVSAAIAHGQRIVWAQGFGEADISTHRPAADTTAYHLASLTKPFASTVLLQLVEEGKVSLDDPVSTYGIALGASIRVRHLLSHTSSGTPGTVFRYDGDRFSLLDSVIARAAGKPFAAALQERVVAPIGLRNTAPNPQSNAFTLSGMQHATVEGNLARGYTYARSEYTLTVQPNSFSTAAGLTASARDVAEFSMALERDALLRPETRALAFAPVVTPAGDTLPYGLGWFATSYGGVRLVWHYGLWTAMSSLIIVVPSRGLTFVLLANTDALSAAYPLGSGQLATSPWARAFLDAFVVGTAPLP